MNPDYVRLVEVDMGNMPSAVRKQGEESERLAEEHGLKGQGKKEVETPKPAAEPVKQEKPKAQEHDWETRFKNYKLETDKTISDLRDQLGATLQQNNDIMLQNQQLIAKMQEKPAVVEPAKPTAEDEFDINSLPADLRDKYDPEFLQSMSELNKAQTIRMIGAMQAQLNELAGDVKQVKGNVTEVKTTQAKSARQLYYEHLDKDEPTWETIGADDKFIAFLKNPVSDFDARPYAQVLEKADKESDSATVLKIIAAYKKATADVSGAEDVDDTTLDEFVDPSGGNGGQNIVDDIGPQTKSFTESQVKQFYVDWASGKKYSNTEATAIEKSIQAAQQAGKILPG